MGFSDLGCYGGEIRTPHVDRMAEEMARGRQLSEQEKAELMKEKGRRGNR